MGGDAHQFLRDPDWRQRKIDTAGGNGAGRHGGVFGRFLVLGEGDAAGGLDGPQPTRAVRAVARKNDADGPAAFLLGEGFQEMVDRRVHVLGRSARGHLQSAAGQINHLVGRDDVNPVGLQPQIVFGLGHGHCRGAGQQRAERALVGRIQVLHQHEGHPGRFGQVLQKLGHRFQPARRGADADNRKGLTRGRFVGSGLLGRERRLVRRSGFG